MVIIRRRWGKCDYLLFAAVHLGRRHDNLIIFVSANSSKYIRTQVVSPSFVNIMVTLTDV